MTVETGLKRVSSVDFFASLPAGFYTFLVLFTVLGASAEATQGSLWNRMEPLLGEVERHPALGILILFASYLLGSILRTPPVGTAERLVAWRRERFPYATSLLGDISILREEAAAAGIDPTRLVTLQGGLSRVVFNYWKDVLAVRAPGALQYYEGFEARSRFFAGMFWAGVGGLVVSFWMLMPMTSFPFLSAIQLLVASAALAGTFGAGLRRVRRQEAGVLLALYCALRQEDASTRGTAST